MKYSSSIVVSFSLLVLCCYGIQHQVPVSARPHPIPSACQAVLTPEEHECTHLQRGGMHAFQTLKHLAGIVKALLGLLSYWSSQRMCSPFDEYTWAVRVLTGNLQHCACTAFVVGACEGVVGKMVKALHIDFSLQCDPQPATMLYAGGVR